MVNLILFSIILHEILKLRKRAVAIRSYARVIRLLSDLDATPSCTMFNAACLIIAVDSIIQLTWLINLKDADSAPQARLTMTNGPICPWNPGNYYC
jgi:hypothetical protein